MTLRTYYGELLLVPYPLELSLLEPCDYACSYCFAILGDRARHFNKSDVQKEKARSREVNSIQETLSLVVNAHKRKTLEARLFNDGYPVLMSNRTDPFGRKNRNASIALIEIFQEINKPIAFQTKGFIQHDKDFERVMAAISPSHWYISISFHSDDLRKRIEPGATPIEYRWELVKELKRRGHVVSIGLNPFVPEWLGEKQGIDLFIQKMVDAQVDACCIQPLHLNHAWIMTDREKDNLHGGDMAWWDKVSGKRRPPDDWREAFGDAHLDCYNAGIPMIGHHFGWKQDLWGSTHALYPKTFPTIADFALHCFNTKQPGDMVTFEEWYEWVISWGVPNDKVYPWGQSIALKSWRTCKKITEHYGWEKFKNNLRWREFLRICWTWQGKLDFFTPAANPAFPLVVDTDNKIVLDNDGVPLLCFQPPNEHPLQYVEYVRI